MCSFTRVIARARSRSSCAAASTAARSPATLRIEITEDVENNRESIESKRERITNNANEYLETHGVTKALQDALEKQLTQHQMSQQEVLDLANQATKEVQRSTARTHELQAANEELAQRLAAALSQHDMRVQCQIMNGE